MKYEAITIHNSKVPAGTEMKLSEEQLRRRKHLGVEKDGIFVSEDAMQFKLGEVVELKGELDMKYNKHLFRDMSAVKTEGMDKEKSKKEEKPKKKEKGKV